MRLKATKTSLYKLVSEYMPLPIMKRTEFTKLSRGSYILVWYDADGVRCSAFFHACLGGPLLSIETDLVCEVNRLTVQELQEKDMLEDKTDCA